MKNSTAKAGRKASTGPYKTESSSSGINKNNLHETLVNYNTRALSIEARTGINPALFFNASKDFNLPVQLMEQILHISGKTIQNKIEKKLALGPIHSEHLLKLISLYMKGVELFGNVHEFNHWLNKPFWFSNEKPVDWLVTPGGIDTVMDELVKLAYGDTL